VDTIQVRIANEHADFVTDEDRLRRAVAGILAEAGRSQATISVAIVDDTTIHELNARYLQHDYPTDVLSFVLEQDDQRLEGEIVVSADTARTVAARLAWPADDELLLYVIHGALHLVGFDDDSDADLQRMRQQETIHLARFGITPRYDA
jgi:probable rRNA maturation factor